MPGEAPDWNAYTADQMLRLGKKTKNYWSGSGAYKGLRRTIGNALIGAGGAVGGVGGMGASLLGTAIKGRGAYETVTNSLINDGEDSPTGPPNINEGQEGDMIISHREYITDIMGPPSGTNGAFSTRISYAINAAQTNLFSFLAQTALNYDEYEFIQLIFEFKSTLTDYTSTGTCGSIMMATQYNATALPFTSKATMIEYDGCSSATIMNNLLHGVECDPDRRQGTKIMTTSQDGYVPSNQDAKTINMGTFQLALINIPTTFENQQLGELWVYYRVRLGKPKLFTGLKLNLRYSAVTNLNPGASLATATPLGPLSSLLSDPGSNLGMTYQHVTSPATGLKLTWPSTISQGRFKVWAWWSGLAALTNTGIANAVNCNTPGLYYSSMAVTAASTTVTGSECQLTFYVDISAANASIIITASGMTGDASCSVQLIVQEVGSGLIVPTAYINNGSGAFSNGVKYIA